LQTFPCSECVELSWLSLPTQASPTQLPSGWTWSRPSGTQLRKSTTKCLWIFLPLKSWWCARYCAPRMWLLLYPWSTPRRNLSSSVQFLEKE
jgi:hypothetical protein